MTNEIESATNVVNVVTSSHLSITPEQVKYNFKEWMGVIDSIGASLYVAFHVVFPKVQAFMDSREGGALQAGFFKLFGKPKSISAGSNTAGRGTTEPEAPSPVAAASLAQTK